VRLPITSFNLRANSVVREPEIQRWWADTKVYESLAENNAGEEYTLHDGPPYANGDLHIGHALNKILKDFINRWGAGGRAGSGPGVHGVLLCLM
jgi:isoleucyl-tRNA synthetase